MITIEFIVIILCLLIGTRFGGMGLGLISGIGLFVLSFVFGLQPGKPPVDVMLTILAVIGCAATLQTAGGLNVMMQFAERLLRKHPQHITLLAPFTTWMLTFLCGTGHVVSHHVSHYRGYRPEKRHTPGTADGGGLGGISDGDHRLPRFRGRRFAGLDSGVRSTVSATRGGSLKFLRSPYRPHCLASPLRHCGACVAGKTSQTILNFRKS